MLSNSKELALYNPTSISDRRARDQAGKNVPGNDKGDGQRRTKGPFDIVVSRRVYKYTVLGAVGSLVLASLIIYAFGILSRYFSKGLLWLGEKTLDAAEKVVSFIDKR